MIIDAHVHIGNWKYKWYSHFKYEDSIKIYNWIDRAVFIPSDSKDNINILNILKKKTKEDGIGTWYFVPWFDPKKYINNIEYWFEDLEWIKNNIRFIYGLKIHSSLDKIYDGINSLIYLSILQFAQIRNLPLFIHCGRWQETAGYQLALDCAEKHPDLKFVLAHLGGDREDLKILAPQKCKEMGLKNVWFDISATREWWTIGMAIELLGTDRIVFGSDYPVMHPKMSIESVKALYLTKEEEELVFAKNILEVMNVD